MQTPELNPDQVSVDVVTTYLPTHSRPDEGHYTFAYTITISNGGDIPVQLMSRRWLITDGDDQVQEVRGEGVVGEQPIIGPGASFRYTSGATLATPVGCMEGTYFMVARAPQEIPPEDLPTFEVAIPAFTLHTPTGLN